MKIFLFDIDGTLIRTRGAGLKAIGQAMFEMFGIHELPQVAVHGRTDVGILRDLFSACGIPFEDHQQSFVERYWELLPEAMHGGDGILLPGVGELLNRLQVDGHELGLLTGNAEVAAKVKLRHFGLERFFHFGGYGDRYQDRNLVAESALKSAERKLGADLDLSNVWVIGDTLRDISCARHIGVRVAAVETG